MAVTLVEAAKMHRGDVIRSTVIETFARSSDLLRVLPFKNIAGNAYKYAQEDTLPGIGFRGLNEGYTESTGIINPLTEALVIAGGDVDVDKFIVDTEGSDQRTSQELMKIKKLAGTITDKCIKGDSITTAKEFDGLQVRLVTTGSQVVSSGGTAAGDPMSLNLLDSVIDAVDEPTHLYMTKAMRRRLTQAARDYTVGGFITYGKDEFGRRLTMYNDLPLLIADENGAAANTMGFNEASAQAGSTSTSIYALSLKEGALMGIQNGIMDVRDMGELEDKPVFRTRIEWYVSLLLEHPRAAARLYGISDAAIVA
jgi:hypothetical protein